MSHHRTVLKAINSRSIIYIKKIFSMEYLLVLSSDIISGNIFGK